MAKKVKKRKTKSRKKKQQKRWTLWLIVLFFGVAFVSMLALPSVRFHIKRIFKHYYNEEVDFSNSKQNLGSYTIYGVDVSEYQSVISWKKLRENKGLEFVFIRASAGVNHRDKYLTYNWREAKKHGFVRGVYHYYRPNENSIKQAENFLKQISLEQGDLPPVLDIENYSQTQSLSSLKSGVLKWLQKVEKETGVKPIIYTYYKYYESHFSDDERFNDYQFWLARYGRNQIYNKPGGNWIFWQYTQFGKLSGVEGNVDLNVFFGSFQELSALLIDKS